MNNQYSISSNARTSIIIVDVAYYNTYIRAIPGLTNLL